jgi:hypothetical protein
LNRKKKDDLIEQNFILKKSHPAFPLGTNSQYEILTEKASTYFWFFPTICTTELEFPSKLKHRINFWFKILLSSLAGHCGSGL